MEKPETVSLEQVRHDEMQAIRARRAESGLAPPIDPAKSNGRSDLVGLAMSGGGLRSASFCLGIVQVFVDQGLWKFIDYLSTVSGGGYVAAFLASHLVRSRTKLDRANCPLRPETNGQSADIQRFIYGGRFLFRPWEMGNKYLIGLAFINASIFSLITLIAAVVAYLWRCLDNEGVRDLGMLLGLRGDLMYAILPFLFFLFCWLVAWMVSFFRRGAEAPGKWARAFLMATGISLAVGIAILMGNGDIDMSMFSGSTKEYKWNQNKGLIATVIGLTLSALIPFLAPKRLIQSGLHPKNHWEQWLFGLASFAALAGIPLILVGYFAQENISGYNTNRYRPVCSGDVERVESLVALLWPADQLGLELLQHYEDKLPSKGNLDSSFLTKARQYMESLRKKLDKPTTAQHVSLYRQLYLSECASEPFALSELAADSSRFVKLNAYRAAVKEALSHDPALRINNLQRLDPTNLAPIELSKDTVIDDLPNRRLCLLILLNEVERARALRNEQYFGLNRDVSIWEGCLHRATNIGLAVSYFTGLYDPENDAAELLKLTHFRRKLLDNVSTIMSEDVLGYSLLVRAEDETATNRSKSQLKRSIQLLEAQKSGRTAKAEVKAAEATGEEQLTQLSAVEKQRLENLMVKVSSHGAFQLTPSELYEANVLLIGELHNTALRPRSAVRRLVTASHDQVKRLWIIACSALLLLCVGVWVDANATSMHRFYRTRLAQAFVVPPRTKAESPMLTDLERTTECGSPYFLFNASSGLLIDHTGNEQLTAVDPQFKKRMPDFRPIDTFLFSSKYCGSDSLGYVRTDQYEEWVRGDENHLMLSEAIAISGAAISPGQMPNKLVAFLMFVLNLRLGQWLPNPARGAPGWRPRVLPLLFSQCKLPKNRDYCFVTDGGNSENLGLLSLLRRRCRLIIQIDSSHDPRHELEDLARVFRIARVHDGIEVVSLEEGDREMDAESIRLRDPDDRKKRGELDLARAICDRHFFIARIVYPDDGPRAWKNLGTLVYIKPSFTGDESIDLQQFRKANPLFPHEPTSDQTYEPEQVEAYRQLGWHIARQLFRETPFGELDVPKKLDDESFVEALCEQIESKWLGTPDDVGRNKVAATAVPAT